MSCECIRTAVLRENEIEKLTGYIKYLENKLLECQKELLEIYSSQSSSVYSSTINSPKSNASYTTIQAIN